MVTDEVSMTAKKRILYPQWQLQIMLAIDSVLECVIAFFVFLQLVGMVLGNPVMNGVEVRGWAAALPPLMVVAYFVFMYKHGGTVSMRFNRWLASRRY